MSIIDYETINNAYENQFLIRIQVVKKGKLYAKAVLPYGECQPRESKRLAYFDFSDNSIKAIEVEKVYSITLEPDIVQIYGILIDHASDFMFQILNGRAIDSSSSVASYISGLVFFQAIALDNLKRLLERSHPDSAVRCIINNLTTAMMYLEDSKYQELYSNKGSFYESDLGRLTPVMLTAGLETCKAFDNHDLGNFDSEKRSVLIHFSKAYSVFEDVDLEPDKVYRILKESLNSTFLFDNVTKMFVEEAVAFK